MEFLTRMFPELLRMLFILAWSFIPSKCGLKNSFKSAFPFQSLMLHLGITEKCLSDGDCSSPVSVSHRFTVPGCCFPFWILSSSHITRCLFEEFVLLFWDNVWKSLGFFMCGSSGWQFHDVSWQDSPFLTELTNLSLTMGWIEQCWLPEMLFSLGLMAQGC